MDEEVWMEDIRREAGWDARLKRRPRCADCGEHISEEECLELERGVYLCPGCVRWRWVGTEAVGA